MAQYVADRLTRGESAVGQFAIANANDLQLPDAIAVDLTERNAIEEWRRKPYMKCHVIATGLDYRLGADITIAGQVWTEIEYSDPNALVYDDVFDVDGFIKPSLIKNLFINDAYVIASEAAMLALSTVTGNALIRTDTGQVFIKLNNDDPSDITDFADITGNTGAVTSVNGQTGAVSITIANLLAVPQNQTDFDAAVDSNALVLSHSAALSGISTNKADLVAGTVPLSQLPYVFQSGLTRSTNEVKLGGDLLYDTEIGVDTFNLVVNAENGKFGIDVGSDSAYDLLARGADGYLYRIPLGDDGDVLKIVGGEPQWSADAGAIGGHVIKNNGTALTARVNLNFSNGLTASDNTPDTDVKLGGVLTSNTSVLGTGTYSLTLGSGGSPLTTFVVNTDLNIVLSAGANAELLGTTEAGIASSTGNAYVDGQTDVDITAITGAVRINAETSITIDSGSGNFNVQGNGLLVVSTGSNLIQSTTAATNIVTNVLSLLSASSGTPAIGIGTGIQFLTHTDIGLNSIGAGIESISTDVTSGSEDFDLVFKTMSGGATAAERLRIKSGGQARFTKDVAITDSANGVILKDTQGTPHYWRVTVNNSGVLVITDLGTSLP